MREHAEKYSILLVDDDAAIREMLTQFLTADGGYEVFTADNGANALAVLEKTRVDLILSDIQMPGMMGFDLLKIVRERHPNVKRVLITACNVEDYLDLALNYDIGNILVKSVPFNFSELDTVLGNLLEEKIFGLERHFAQGTEMSRRLVKKHDELAEDAREIVAPLDQTERGKKLELVLVELITNAMFYGVRKEDPENRQAWDFNFELTDENAIEITSAADAEKYAIAVKDRGGRLKKKDVLYWLHRQVAQGSDGMPLGLFDTHGRGLFIARRYIDRLIVNINRDKETELVVVNYRNQDYAGSKPILINEL